jgi:hypothetical protein
MPTDSFASMAITPTIIVVPNIIKRRAKKCQRKLALIF